MKWEKKLNEWTYREVPADTVNAVKPRVALRELEKALAATGKGAVVSTDIGNTVHALSAIASCALMVCHVHK